jgi:hypothetical protein
LQGGAKVARLQSANGVVLDLRGRQAGSLRGDTLSVFAGDIPGRPSLRREYLNEANRPHSSVSAEHERLEREDDGLEPQN